MKYKKRKKLYDVYFKPKVPMCVLVEATSAKEAERIVRFNEGEILDDNELLERFKATLSFNDTFSVCSVEKVDEEDEEE